MEMEKTVKIKQLYSVCGKEEWAGIADMINEGGLLILQDMNEQ
jgi:hypothetical protein